MTETLTTSLLITLMGMGLVFGSILLFWALMSVLVRVTADRSPTGEEVRSGEEVAAERAWKARAALVAVAVALAREAEAGPQPFPLPPTALVSTWQAVLRAKQLGQRGAVR